MSGFDHGEDVITDFVQDSVLPLANTVALLFRKPLKSTEAWIIGELSDAAEDPCDVSLGNAAQILGDRGSKAEALYLAT